MYDVACFASSFNKNLRKSRDVCTAIFGCPGVISWGNTPINEITAGTKPEKPAVILEYENESPENHHFLICSVSGSGI